MSDALSPLRLPTRARRVPFNPPLTMMDQNSPGPSPQELAIVTPLPSPTEQALPDRAASGGRWTPLLLDRQRRILFGLAVVIMGLGIIAVTQSFHSAVLANAPDVRWIVPAEPAALPVQARPTTRVGPTEAGLDTLLFQPAPAVAAPVPSGAFKPEPRPAPAAAPAPRERRHAVSRSASCDDPIPKNAWLDICG